MSTQDRRGAEYAPGELEVILSLVPTEANISHLSDLLGRSRRSLKIVYRIAYQQGPFADGATAQQRKVLEAKARLGIVIGRTTNRHLKNPKP